ncbi:MAG: SusD/RagB family nutrient-binding outer membrane lipoprotein [Flavobacteriales bacterium]|nr:SusD/RagB family nutrient-binding outer membrane lipoprotein [Flavobacteriales bacterium]
MVKGKHIFRLILLTVLLQIGCTKGFEELNPNPNAPTEVEVEYLFTRCVIRTFDDYLVGVNTEIWSLMVWTQQLADLSGIQQEGAGYSYGNEWGEQVWKVWYTDVIANLNEIIRHTEGAETQINKQAIAKIWKVYVFHKITDLWGDVPYSEAGKGNNETNKNLTPAYDSQSDIYVDMLAELKSAVESFDDEFSNYGAADPIYNGDFDSWRRFANTLRLRLAMRISKVNPALAQSVTEELMLQNEFITSNSDAAYFPFGTEARSPFFNLYDLNQGERRPSYYLMEKLKGTNDPRLIVFAEKASISQILGTDVYEGVPNLMSFEEIEAANFSDISTSTVGSRFLNIDEEGLIIGYPELCFLQAEAAINGWGGSLTAQKYYEDGVTAAMEYYNVPTDSIANYLAGDGSFNGTLEQVGEQKWLALIYKDAYESYAEYRRTGFPVLLQYDGSTINQGNYPQRLAYPQSEVNLNGDNVGAVGEGINDSETKLWWAQ